MAMYHVPCSALRNAYNRGSLENSWSHQKSNFQRICANGKCMVPVFKFNIKSIW